VSVIGLLAVDAAHKNKEFNYNYYYYYYYYYYYFGVCRLNVVGETRDLI
jgi:hypothetical protein